MVRALRAAVVHTPNSNLLVSRREYIQNDKFWVMHHGLFWCTGVSALKPLEVQHQTLTFCIAKPIGGARNTVSLVHAILTSDAGASYDHCRYPGCIASVWVR